MKKILVPTDFSVNSKAGVRFAINWATRSTIELDFVHVLNVLRLTRWSDAYFEKYAAQEVKLASAQLEKWIAGLYRQMNVKPGKHSFLVIQGLSPDVSILEHCRSNPGIDFICISTRGAGKIKKIFGTNTGNLISRSQIPVLAIPKNYRTAPVKSIMYASDLGNYADEIDKVMDFAQSQKAKIDVVHLSSPHEVSIDRTTLQMAFRKKFKYGFELHFEKSNTNLSLVENLQKQISFIKPSVVIMFTYQQRNFFQRLFISSRSQELSFKTTVPLLVFNKMNASQILLHIW